MVFHFEWQDKALVFVGFFTRPAAFILCGAMAVAYFMVHASRGNVLMPMLTWVSWLSCTTASSSCSSPLRARERGASTQPEQRARSGNQPSERAQT